MCLAIQEMMDDTRADAICDFVRILYSLNIPDSDIFEKIKTQFNLTDEKMEEYMKVAKVE